LSLGPGSKDEVELKPKSPSRLLLEKAFPAIARSYVRLTGFRLGRLINDALIHLALRGRGYNNCCDPRSTGELHFMRFLADQSPKLCVDVGANVGSYSRYILENSSAHVFAFEPLPQSFEALRLLGSEFPSRVSMFDVGLGDCDTDLELFFGSENSELASFSPEVNQIDYVGASNVNKVWVQMKKLDYFLEDMKQYSSDIDLLKIDTEGFEWEVLLGSAESIQQLQPRYVQIEFNLHQLLKGKTIYSFSSLLPGYRIFQMLPYKQGLVERSKIDALANVFLYSNFVFIRPDINLDRARIIQRP
jgi:FkbM family methyltransferase